MLARVADLIEANAEAIASEWLTELERRGNRLVSPDNRTWALSDGVKWITVLLHALRDGDLEAALRTSPLTAQRLALGGFPASDAIESFVVFKYVLWRLLRKASRRGQVKLAPTVERLEILFDKIINALVEEYERTWQARPADAAVVRRAKHLSVRAEEEAILSSLAREMAGATDVDHLLEVAVKSATNLVGARKGFGALTDSRDALERCVGYRIWLPRIEQRAREHPEAVAELAHAAPRAVRELSEEASPGLRLLGETLRARSALAVPVRSERGAIGFLALFDKLAEEPWSDRDLALAEEVAEQSAQAIERARGRREIEERAEQLALLNEIGRELSWQLSPANLVALAGAKMAELLRAASSIVWLDDGGRQFKPAAAHDVSLLEGEMAFRRGGGVLGRAVASGQPAVVSAEEDDLGPLSLLGVRSAILVPLHGGKRTIGLLTVHDKRDGPFSANDVQLASALETQLSISLQNAELYQQGKQLARKLHTSIASMGSALSAALDLDDLLQLIADHGLELSDARACTVLFLEDQHLERRGAAFAEGRGGLELRADLERRLARSAMESAEPMAVTAASERLGAEDKAALRSARMANCLALPLVIKGQPMGAMLVWGRRARTRGAEAEALLESFSRQAAVGIENVMLFENTQKRVVELMDLSWVSEQMSATLDEPAVIETVVRGIARALDREIAGIGLLEGEDALRIPEKGYIGPREVVPARVALPDGECLARRVLSEGRFAAVDDTAALASGRQPLIEAVGARSLACAPLIGRGGTFGLLFVGDTTARPIRSHEEALLGAYAGQAALALENARHHRDVVERARELETLLDLTRSLSSTLELEETLHNVLRAAAGLLRAPVCSILLVHEETGELSAQATYGIERDHLLHGPLRLGEGIGGTVAQTGQAIWSRDLLRDGRFRARDGAKQEGLVSLLAVPLVSKGRTLGVLNVYTRTVREFSPREQALLFTLASEACVAIENARLYEDARHQARSMRTVMEEVNHRIKNNLQIIVGLMHLYMAECGNPATCRALQEIVGRIQAIAVVHELLFEADVTEVDAREASQRILDNARQTMGRPDLKVRGRIAGVRIQLPSRQATALASAVNELVCNAIQHGFPDRPEGTIQISFQEGGGRVLVQVKDDGVGLPDGFDVGRDGRLGLRLVQGVVEQDLQGEFTVSGNAGTTARIAFAR